MPSDTEGNTLINAVIGAVVTVVTSFVPFSPIVGGAVAAYLEGGTRGDATRVGAFAGLLLIVPLTPILLLGVVMAPFDFGVTFLVLLFALVVGAIYAVGFSALGGYLAAYAMEYPTDATAGRDGGSAGPPRRNIADDPTAESDR